MIVYYRNFGIAFFMPSSFARYSDEGSFYGPYTLWFERKFLCFYWAVTPPKRKFGIST